MTTYFADNMEGKKTWNHPLVATIGGFDGVHRGHKALIAHLQAYALRWKKKKVQTALITFSPHPKHILQPQKALELLCTEEEKKVLLQAFNIDHIIILRFDKKLQYMTKEAFLDMLMRQFHVEALVVGENHRFGYKGEGNVSYLREVAKKGVFRVEIFKGISDEGGVISSTRIRKAVVQGDIAKANALLGYSYHFSAQVEAGLKIGRTLGFATANLVPISAHKLMPKHGVYAVKVRIGDDSRLHGGIFYIGKKEIKNISVFHALSVEVHIFGLPKEMDLYGQSLHLTFVAYLREGYTMESLHELKTHLMRDKAQAIALLSGEGLVLEKKEKYD